MGTTPGQVPENSAAPSCSSRTILAVIPTTRTNRRSVELTLAPCLTQTGWCACTSWNSSSSHSDCVVTLLPRYAPPVSPPLAAKITPSVFPFQNTLTQVWCNRFCLCLVRHRFRAVVFPLYRWNEIRKWKPALMDCNLTKYKEELQIADKM